MAARHEFSNTTASAAGLTGVKLTAGVGSIHILRRRVRIPWHQGRRGTERQHALHLRLDHRTLRQLLPAGLHLVTRREGSQLVVSLATGAGSAASASSADSGHKKTTIDVSGHTYTTGDNPGWKANWTLVLPVRLALDLTVGVGKAQITGVGGGLRARIGVGKLTAQLPRGPVDANVGVGDVKAFITGADYGTVKLTAGVGHVEFDVNGQRNKTGYTSHFTSAEQQVNGSGKTGYSLKSGVGHVDLEIGVKDLPKSNGND